jgi:hypothetical protein
VNTYPRDLAIPTSGSECNRLFAEVELKRQTAGTRHTSLLQLLQLRVLRLGFFQDGNVGVGVFPEGEEIFAGGEGADAGGIGSRSLRGSGLQGVGTFLAVSADRGVSGPLG